MQNPADFLREYFSVRNAVMRRHAVEQESFQKKFFNDFRLYDARFSDYEGERILEVSAADTHASITTTGTMRGKIAMRSRYQLVAIDEAWFIHDLETECPACGGRGLHNCIPGQCKVASTIENPSSAEGVCRVCGGGVWISIKKKYGELLEE
jgi:hypothetical protein